MAEGWFSAGATLGVALDLDHGTLLVSVNRAEWKVALQAGCAPSNTVGAGLFPAVSGKGGVRLRCRWGGDAMTHGPPAGGYRAVALLHTPQQVPPHPPSRTSKRCHRKGVV